jgi:hypothetical protein
MQTTVNKTYSETEIFEAINSGRVPDAATYIKMIPLDRLTWMAAPLEHMAKKIKKSQEMSPDEKILELKKECDKRLLAEMQKTGYTTTVFANNERATIVEKQAADIKLGKDDIDTILAYNNASDVIRDAVRWYFTNMHEQTPPKQTLEWTIPKASQPGIITGSAPVAGLKIV